MRQQPTIDDYVKERVNILVHPDYRSEILIDTMPVSMIYPNPVMARAAASSLLAVLCGFPAGEPDVHLIAEYEQIERGSSAMNAHATGEHWNEVMSAGTWRDHHQVPVHYMIDGDN